jgi:hypothetical protein
MTYFTVLAFFLASGDLIGDPLMFRSLQDCSDHMQQYAFRKELREIDMFCIQTDMASSSPRPRYRPE